MSYPTVLTSTALATLWKKGTEDRFGVSQFASPILLRVCIDNNYSQKYTNRGIENAPNSVMYIEVSDTNPEKGDHIAKGDFTSLPLPELCSLSEIITDVNVQDCSFLGEPDDLMILT